MSSAQLDRSGGRWARVLARLRVLSCAVTTLAMASVLVGCSFLAVNGAPRESQWHLVPPERCTSSRAAPAIDTGIATVYLGMGLIGLAAVLSDDGVTGEPALDLFYMLAMPGSFALSALFSGSAAYGYVRTARCEDYEDYLASWGIVLDRPTNAFDRHIEEVPRNLFDEQVEPAEPNDPF